MAVKYQDYYEMLEVPRSASQDEIRKSYRRLARRYHPDVNKTKEAEERFKRIGEAYEVLGDPEKRKRYDTLGENWQAGQEFTPPPGWEFFGQRGSAGGTFRFDGSPFGGFSEFFETLFGGGQGGFENADSSRIFGRGRPGDWGTKGGDLEADISITLEEAYSGVRKQISFDGARGRRAAKSLEVRIPPGTADGKKLRLAGQGEPSIAGGPPGDLYLTVHIDVRPPFRIDGSDIEVEVPVTPWEAALGAKIEIPIVGGSASVKLPPGISSRQKLRLRGKGLLKQGGERGDLYAVIHISVPKHLSARERELFEELARSSQFNPRSR